MARPRISVPRLSLPAALVVCAALILLTAWALYWMGRLPVCKCGTIKFWYTPRSGPEMSQHFADWYTYSHVMHGVAFYFGLTLIARGHLSVAARLVAATLIECGWEVVENTAYVITRFRNNPSYFGDTIINSVGDVLAMIVGFLIAARLPAWVTVALFLATEAVLLILTKDSLLLTILLLIHPMDWVREWQATR